MQTITHNRMDGKQRASTGNYIQRPGINHNGKEHRKECIYVNEFSVISEINRSNLLDSRN